MTAAEKIEPMKLYKLVKNYQVRLNASVLAVLDEAKQWKEDA